MKEGKEGKKTTKTLTENINRNIKQENISQKSQLEQKETSLIEAVVTGTLLGVIVGLVACHYFTEANWPIPKLPLEIKAGIAFFLSIKLKGFWKFTIGLITFVFVYGIVILLNILLTCK